MGMGWRLLGARRLTPLTPSCLASLPVEFRTAFSPSALPSVQCPRPYSTTHHWVEPCAVTRFFPLVVVVVVNNFPSTCFFEVCLILTPAIKVAEGDDRLITVSVSVRILYTGAANTSSTAEITQESDRVSYTCISRRETCLTAGERAPAYSKATPTIHIQSNPR